MVRSPREWRWSNYRATSGEAGTPGFLHVGWTLEQFGTDAGQAREGYRRFVAEGQGAGSPMDDVTGQVFLGGAEFVLEMRRRLDDEGWSCRGRGDRQAVRRDVGARQPAGEEGRGKRRPEADSVRVPN
jgi:hypothetical protein